MAHPFAGQARSSSAAKFKGMTGKKSGGAVHSDEAQDRKLFAKMIKDKRAEGGRVPGKAAGGRLDKAARGGVIKKNYGGALDGPGLMPGAVPPTGGLPPQAMATLPPQAMMGAGPPPMPPQAMGGRPFKRGGAVKKDVGGSIEPLRIEGPIEKKGLSTLRREYGRDPVAGRFGKNPYPKTSPGDEKNYKRGGRTSPKVNIKIVSLPGGKDQATPPLPAALPVPPPGLAAAGLPPVAPGGGPPLRPPGGPPSMANRGGRISKMAMGGRAKHTGGDNGVGRLEKSAIAARRNG